LVLKRAIFGWLLSGVVVCKFSFLIGSAEITADISTRKFKKGRMKNLKFPLGVILGLIRKRKFLLFAEKQASIPNFDNIRSVLSMR